ncbi:hypothetical protein L6R52_41720, partial [Myxococcota bacterium]|nr:hypothetical protein [Myxococcota bacterium]
MGSADRPGSSQKLLPLSQTLARVLREAEDIAHATESRLTTSHILLALFTVKNHAERLLRDRGIDEDKLLAVVSVTSKEPKHVLASVLERSSQVAAGCGARSVDALHLLVAITRERDCLAHALLDRAGEKPTALRTRALMIATGAVPRWLDSKQSQPPAHLGPHPSEYAEATSLKPLARSERAERQGRGSTITRGTVSRSASREDRHDRRAALDWSPPIVSSGPRGKTASEPSKRAPHPLPASETPRRDSDPARRRALAPQPERLEHPELDDGEPRPRSRHEE